MDPTCLILLCLTGFFSVEGFVEELNDSFINTRGSDDLWLIKFYAPWCLMCKQLDPVWSEVGSELRSLGSTVRVGRTDATANPVMTKEFRVRSYPAIVLLKNDQKFNYMGPKTKDAILDFTHRVSGPSVRILSSSHLVKNALSRHKVMFLFVGATSELKSNFSSVADDLIVHTNFYSTTRDLLPKTVSVTSFPAVLVFKDDTYFTFNCDSGLDLKSWIQRERFQTFSKLDSFTLYSLGDSGRLVVVAVVGKSRSKKSLRLKSLVQKISSDRSRARDFYFGFVEELDFISGLLMSDEVTVPRLLVLNLTNDSYFVGSALLETQEEIEMFLDLVLSGTLESEGGNSFLQRVKRTLFDIKTSLTPVFREAPVLGVMIVSIPVGVILSLLFLCLKARPSFGDDVVQAETVSTTTRRQKHRKSD